VRDERRKRPDVFIGPDRLRLAALTDSTALARSFGSSADDLERLKRSEARPVERAKIRTWKRRTRISLPDRHRELESIERLPPGSVLTKARSPSTAAPSPQDQEPVVLDVVIDPDENARRKGRATQPGVKPRTENDERTRMAKAMQIATTR
jgi:hypothetical protein